MFESANGYLIALFAIVINLSFYTVLVRNNLDKSVDLPNKFYIGLVIDIEVDRCYYLNNFKEV